MQANTMIFNALDKSKPILVDEFIYDRCLETLILLGFKVIGVPMNKNGIDINELEKLIIKYRPAALWRNIRYNNPTGKYITMDNVYSTGELCIRYNVIHHLDDAYENCGVGLESKRDEGPVDLSHKSLRKTILVRMTTKEFSPHEKISWIVCGRDCDISERIIRFAKASRLNGHYRLQAAYYISMINNDYQSHIAWVNVEFYRPRSLALNKGLNEFFKGFQFEKIKDASFFTTLWLKKIDILKGKKIIDICAQNGIILTPGIPFCAPINIDEQPELVTVKGYPVGISIMSKHSTSILEKMNGYPVRLSPNACLNINDYI